MKTLAVCYSKTGNTKKVADAVVEKLGCDLDELQYDEKSKTMRSSRDPAEYDRVILLTPIWAFEVSEPIKLYLGEHKTNIKEYALIVTCMLGGLKRCVKNCVTAIGKQPEYTLKIKSKAIKQGKINISSI